MIDESEILRLDKMLADAGIPHVLTPCNVFNTHFITYPNTGHGGAHISGYTCMTAHNNNLLEISGVLVTTKEKKNDLFVGSLTAENVFERIKKQWDENQKGNKNGI